MASKAQLEAIKNTLLANGSNITASESRDVVQAIINEMYDTQSRADLFASLSNYVTPLATDKIFLFRSGVAGLLETSLLDFVQNFSDLSDVDTSLAVDDAIVYYNASTLKYESKTLDQFAISYNATAVRDALAGLIGANRLDASAIKNLPSDTAVQTVNAIAPSGGDVTLDADDIAETTARKWVSTSEKSTWNNKYDTPNAVRDALATLTGTNRLDASAIKNLPAAVSGEFLRKTITKTSHGFVAKDVLHVDGSGVIQKISDNTTQRQIGIVRSVIDANNVDVVLGGFIDGLTGLTVGSIHYASNTGTINTTVSPMPILIAITTSSGFLLSSGGGASTIPKASQASVNAGTVLNEYVSPDTLQTKLAQNATKPADFAIVQSENQTIIYINSPTPINCTINQLLVSTFVTLINVGAGDVNFVAGVGVTISGATTLAGGVNASGLIIYRTATNPVVIASGSTSIADNSLALAKLVQITDKRFLGNNSGATGNVAQLTTADARRMILRTSEYARCYSDFIGGLGDWASQNSGTGASVLTNVNGTGQDNHPGAARLSTGTTTTGFAAIRSGTLANIQVGQGSIVDEVILETPAALSNGTDTYTIFAALMDISNADANEGIYFKYSHGVNAGKWQLVTKGATLTTTADSGITVAAATWYRLTVVVNAAGTSAEFFINGTSVGTINTTLPTITGLVCSIVKSAGTTAITMDVDMKDFVQELTR